MCSFIFIRGDTLVIISESSDCGGGGGLYICSGGNLVGYCRGKVSDDSGNDTVGCGSISVFCGYKGGGYGRWYSNGSSDIIIGDRLLMVLVVALVLVMVVRMVVKLQW